MERRDPVLEAPRPFFEEAGGLSVSLGAAALVWGAAALASGNSGGRGPRC